MEWTSINDTKKEIPWTKVCIYDGANTFWAYLQEIRITKGNREVKWNIATPEGYGECKPLYWANIEYPKLQEVDYTQLIN